MYPVIIKRDGAKVPFCLDRIIYAISKAVEEVYNTEGAAIATAIADSVAAELENRTRPVKIDEIQSLVESHLMVSHQDVARAYIEYRQKRDIVREQKTKLSSDIKGLIGQTNDEILNENANKDAKVIPTQRDLLAGIVSKHYAINHLLPKEVTVSHEKGEIHFHDLDYSPFFPSFNCMIVDLKNMLENGFKMGNAEIDSPKSIQTATAVTAQIIAQVASHTYGGTTIDRIDEVLAPYVAISRSKHRATAEEWGIKDVEAFVESRTAKECYDAFQSLEYEINTLHTANGQTPFVTFGFGLGVSQDEVLIQKCILENRIAGLGKNRKTAVFPKLCFAIKKGLNFEKDSPNYHVKRLALECASKRMYPDILNYDKLVENTGSFKTPMGCRSFLNVYKDENGNEIHAGRNNLGVVSLNLPRIGIEARGDEAKFYEILDRRLDICKQALFARIERFRGVKARVAPILYMEGALGIRLNADDEVIDIFKNGRASISLGYIGLHETMTALYGNETHVFDSEELRFKQKQIVQYLRDAVEEWKDQTGWGFSLYATPSENLCNRFCAIDARIHGLIDGVTDKGYYTNSFHLDVAKQVNPYDKIDFEMDLPAISSGGAIVYTEYPSMINNLDALEDVWDYTYDRVHYYGTNTPIDECYECGYAGEFECTSKGFTCPKCGNHDSSKVSVTRRVCGYLGSPDSRPFNAGKQAEVALRYKHMPSGNQES
ncbi:anaerobic ribonucleoside-triphosphate reductase [Vibrio chagasii]|nr:anaerobic ribonucleoside-triphosphate reductase [Vibrio chagasii]